MSENSSLPPSLPLYTTISRRCFAQRVVDIIILVLLLILVLHRLLHIQSHGLIYAVALFCESCFTFLWLIVVNIKWSPVEHKTHLDSLQKRVSELPPVDVFVTTADPVLEPPIITVNTVLSVLAVNYSPDKLACYVSDDGCSPLTYFSLVETAKFAKIWVPFCKKYNVQLRAPFRYFLNEANTPVGADPVEFRREWEKVKMEYEQLSGKLADAARESFRCAGDFAVFNNVERGNHPTIIKVVRENKEGPTDESIPHLIYISREKRRRHPHHYKAGAMNVVTRVSGVMTNAPYMLNLDCDMYVNNPDAVRQAMCFFLGLEKDSDCGFVQSPQLFYDNCENELVVLFEFMGYGIVGIQGPFYSGTNCFHRRKVIYGLSADEVENNGSLTVAAKGKLAEDYLIREFGNSREFVKSAGEALQGKVNHQNDIVGSLESAYQVASCTYENRTSWGKTIGWMYGSTAEDINTGIAIHSKGWKTMYNSPEPPAFLGLCPPGGPAAMSQQKRWATGLLEVLLGRNSPVVGALFGRLSLRQALAYMWVCVWALRSIPEVFYALLPAYSIVNNTNFLPKGPFLCIPIALFTIYNLYTVTEYIRCRLSIKSWWLNQQFARIKATGPWLLGVFNIVFKLLGLSDTVFEITDKSASTNDNDQDPDAGGFIFDDSPAFLPGTTILIVNLTALATLLLGLQPPPGRGGTDGAGLPEVMCSVWVVLSFWPFLRGLFEKGKYGIPLSTIYKASALALVFVLLSIRSVDI